MKRYALVGTGSRARMFVDPLVTTYRGDGELVALCDPNPAHSTTTTSGSKGNWAITVCRRTLPTTSMRWYGTQTPDTVIVTTIDAFHHEYVIRAMELGCDAVTEKPMTVDDEKCRAMLDAVERTGRDLRVTFNYRWSPGTTMVKKVLLDGAIGDVLHVDMEYLLDTSHGADFFRRWHREKKNSGGLLVHKATHHFDLVNWWLDAVPETVFGWGKLAFYGRENAEMRGMKVEYERYSGHDISDDPFAIDLSADERLTRLYYDAEQYDGYQRDRNVFGDGITIEDTNSLLVKYRTGVVLNYSLNAYLPREGFNVVFNGTKGRIEYEEEHASGVVPGQKRDREHQWMSKLRVLPMFGEPYEVSIPIAEGAHGGGDPPLQAQLFSGAPPPDPWGRNAGHGQGAASVLVGIAANRSLETGRPVRVGELCPALGEATRLSELP